MNHPSRRPACAGLLRMTCVGASRTMTHYFQFNHVTLACRIVAKLTHRR